MITRCYFHSSALGAVHVRSSDHPGCECGLYDDLKGDHGNGSYLGKPVTDDRERLYLGQLPKTPYPLVERA